MYISTQNHTHNTCAHAHRERGIERGRRKGRGEEREKEHEVGWVGRWEGSEGLEENMIRERGNLAIW